MILLDTNVLTRITNSSDPDYAVSRITIRDLMARKERLIIVPQNLYEFWAVATRKGGNAPTGQNALGMSPEQAGDWLTIFQRRFSLLPDRDDSSVRWHDLVKRHGIKGSRSHDARLVAAMHSYATGKLMTFNPNDLR